jgi:hypothetical protein
MTTYRRPPSLRLVALAIGAILAVSVATSVTADTATLSAPAQAFPGSTIRVDGHGLLPAQTGEVTYNGDVVAGFGASAAGDFRVVFTIPSSEAVGSVGVISAQDADGVAVASTTVSIVAPDVVRPSLSVPSQAPPGSIIGAFGSHFAPGWSGYLTINGARVATVQASPDGSFAAAFAIPRAARLGTARVSARDNPFTFVATTTIFVNVPPPPTPAATPTDTPAATDQPTPAPPTGGPTPAPATDAPPSGTPAPSLDPAASPSPTDTPAPTDTPSPTDTPTPTDTPAPTPGPTILPSPPATDQPTASPLPPAAGLPNFSHVYVIVFENEEYSSVVGSANAPYINSLVARYGLATNYYGVGHPSEPNYIAMTSGSTQGIADDGVYNLGVDNLFSQVGASGRTWRAYEQGYPGGCFAGSSAPAVADGDGKAGSYVRRHNPAVSYTRISGTAACTHIVGLAAFDPAAANLSFVTPNLINDMHDGTVADGDNFLRSFLPRITGSAAFANSLVLITFDEGASTAHGGGHVATIAITPNMTAGFKASGLYSHYSMLRTIEQAWGLPYLGNAASSSALDFPY